MTSQIRQAAILCGGLGSRLGELTRSTPKPLLPVCNRPFLSILIDELVSQGIREILLLAAFENAQVRNFAEQACRETPGLDITVAVEPARAGTGGALWHARDFLQDRFYLLNGDSWLDAPITKLAERLNASPEFLGALSLRSVPDRSRYGAIILNGQIINEFGGGQGLTGPGLINAGVYLFRRDIVDHLSADSSLENDVLPNLAQAGILTGVEAGAHAYFIDIGIPHDFERAQTEIREHRHRPTLLIDPTCNMIVDWISQARELGWRIFFTGSSESPLPPGITGRIGETELLAGRLDARWPVKMDSSVVVSDDKTLARTAAAAGFRILPLQAPPQF